MNRTERCIKPCGLSASLPSLSLRLSGTFTKSKTERNPNFFNSRISAFNKSKLNRKYPGMEEISSFLFAPSIIKRGTIKKEEISSMPGYFRFSLDLLKAEILELKKLGL